MYESRGAAIRGEISENNEVISTISVFFRKKCVIFGFSGSNIVEGEESLRRDRMELVLIFEMDGYRQRFRFEQDTWEGIRDRIGRSTFIFEQALKEFIAHEKELAENAD